MLYAPFFASLRIKFMMKKSVVKYWIIGTFILFTGNLFAQCPQLNDFFGNPSNNPYWYDCSGGNFTLNINSPNIIGTWTVDWGDGSPISNGASLNPGNNISHLYTSAVDTFNVVFTETSSGCVIQGVVVMEQATSASIQIPIGGLTQTCAPAPLEFINSSTNTSQTTVFTWDFGDGSPLLVTDYTNVGQTISHMYQQGTVNCVTQVTLTAENYCNTIQGGNSTATFNPIRIWDIDDAAINASATLLCYPDTQVTFNNITNRNCLAQGNIAQRYEWWNFGDYWGNGYDSIVGWVPWPPALPYTMAYPGIGSYNVMMVDSSFCGLDTAYITIQIVAPPFAAINSSNDTICEGEAVTFNNLSGGSANAYFWNFGDGSGWVPSAGGNVNHTFNNAGDYTISVVVIIAGGTGGCRDTATIDLHVLASPSANFNFDNNNGCDSMTVNYTNTSSIDAISWNWVFGNGNTSNLQNPPNQFYANTGNYNVQLTVENLNGCTDTRNRTITVYQSPIPAFTPTSVCVNSLATFIDNSTSSIGDPILSWNWNFGDLSTSTNQNPTHTYSLPGFYDMILTVNTAFCSGTDTVQINVENVPTANFSTDTSSGCADLLVNFTNTSSANAVNYIWNFGDGNSSILQNPNHTFTNTFGIDTSYTIQLIAQTAFGCSDTTTQLVTVYPNPIASFTDNATLDCAPLIVDFTNTSTGYTSQIWNFGDGSPTDITNNPSHTFENLTLFINNHTVLLTVFSLNGCVDTISKNITVYPEPQFGFSVNPDSGCSPLIVNFPSVIGAVVYNWDFGDGNNGSGPTPNHIFENTSTNNQTFTVTLTATSPFGCTDTTYGNVLVFPNPTAQFSVNDSNGCHPFNINFTNNSTGGTYYHWNMGDGVLFDTLASNFSHTYSNTSGGLQNISANLIVETDKGCLDTAEQNITVYPDLTAIIQADTVGCSPFNSSLSSLSIGAVNYFWDFDDGSPISNLQNPTHQFVNTGVTDRIFNVRLIVESIYGCFDTTYQQILVYPQTTALFNTNVTVGCQPLNVTFNNNSSNGFLYHWNFGNGTTSDTLASVFNYTYYNNTGIAQNYTITLISETNKGCLDTASQNVTIYPEIVANFITDTAGCSPLNNTFVNTSTGANTFIWNFGDGSALDNSPSPSHSFVNSTPNDITYSVSLIAESFYGCRDTINKQVTIYATPIASFVASPMSQAYPSSVVLTSNTSSFGFWQYQWYFGDGDTSSLLSPPNHVYNTWGNFNISLVVSGTHCSDSTFTTIEIIPPVPVADFSGEGKGCRPLRVQFVNNSSYANQYSWSFGDGGISSQTNPSYTYYNPGIYNVTLTAIGDGGTNTIVKNQIIEVYEIPQAFFTATPSSITIPGQAVTLYNLSSFASSYEWNFGDENFSTEENPQHYYTSPGLFDITLVATSINNCKDTFKLVSAVDAKAEGIIKIPNAFTPNPSGGNGGVVVAGDLNNDVFHPIIFGAEKYELNIFNKWGELLFISKDVNIGWDGYYREKLVQQDVYVYKIQVTFVDGRSETFVGDITLLR